MQIYRKESSRKALSNMEDNVRLHLKEKDVNMRNWMKLA